MAVYELTGASPYYPLHLFGGFLLFSAGRLLLDGSSCEPSSALDRALRWSDSYSYEVYLVHQVLILGDFSLALVFPDSPLLVILGAVFWSLLASFALHQLSELIYRAIGFSKS